MKKVIVTTTINAPTEAIQLYDRMPDWELVVVGDSATPKYRLRNGTFISWREQQERYPDLCELIGPGSVARGRMIGFIEAANRNAVIVASIDDDCIPKENWGKRVYVGQPRLMVDRGPDQLVTDPYYPFVRGKFWHRGFPWRHQGISQFSINQCLRRQVVPLLQEDLCDGEADVDAIFRVGGGSNELRVPHGYETPFAPARFCPVNTQSIFILGRVLQHHFGNIPFIGRADDIWAGYLFQKRFPGRTVYGQITNTHSQHRSHISVMRDFRDELFSYEHTADFLAYLDVHSIEDTMARFLPRKSIEAIRLYRSYF
jgi:hypothetical protein